MITVRYWSQAPSCSGLLSVNTHTLSSFTLTPWLHHSRRVLKRCKSHFKIYTFKLLQPHTSLSACVANGQFYLWRRSRCKSCLSHLLSGLWKQIPTCHLIGYTHVGDWKTNSSVVVVILWKLRCQSPHYFQSHPTYQQTHKTRPCITLTHTHWKTNCVVGRRGNSMKV
jgi:hypothetical protein